MCVPQDDSKSERVYLRMKRKQNVCTSGRNEIRMPVPQDETKSERLYLRTKRDQNACTSGRNENRTHVPQNETKTERMYIRTKRNQNACTSWWNEIRMHVQYSQRIDEQGTRWRRWNKSPITITHRLDWWAASSNNYEQLTTHDETLQSLKYRYSFSSRFKAYIHYCWPCKAARRAHPCRWDSAL